MLVSCRLLTAVALGLLAWLSVMFRQVRLSIDIKCNKIYKILLTKLNVRHQIESRSIENRNKISRIIFIGRDISSIKFGWIFTISQRNIQFSILRINRRWERFTLFFNFFFFVTWFFFIDVPSFYLF